MSQERKWATGPTNQSPARRNLDMILPPTASTAKVRGLSLSLFDEAERQAVEGMNRALAHAGPSWANAALDFLKTYAATHGTFIGEECTSAARAAGLVCPRTEKAWGPLYRKAAKQGIIVQVGISRSARRHRAWTPVWQAKPEGPGDA